MDHILEGGMMTGFSSENGFQAIESFHTVGGVMGYGLYNETELIKNCQKHKWLTEGDILLGTLYLLISAVGICKNIHIFFRIFALRKEKHSTSKISFFILIGNLSMGDIIILTLPLWISTYGFFRGRNILDSSGDALIAATVFLHSCGGRSSILFVMLIAIFRAISIRSPLQSTRVATTIRAIILSSLAWIVVIGAMVYTLMREDNNIRFVKATALCQTVKNDTDTWSVTGQLLAPFLIPGFMTLLALAYLFYFLLKMYKMKATRYTSNKSSYRPQKEWKSLVMTIQLIVIFTISYTPWYINGISKLLTDTSVQTSQIQATNWNCFTRLYWEHLSLGGFLFLSSAVNPFIYGETLLHHQQVHGDSQIALRTINTFSVIKRSIIKTKDDPTSDFLNQSNSPLNPITTSPKNKDKHLIRQIYRK